MLFEGGVLLITSSKLDILIDTSEGLRLFCIACLAAIAPASLTIKAKSEKLYSPWDDFSVNSANFVKSTYCEKHLMN